VVEARNALPGQAPEVPVQFSATSQEPAAARQTVVLADSVFEGQLDVTPSQVSAGSQIPVDARQVVVVPESVSTGHVAAPPVQFSDGSQTPVDARQSVVEADNVSAGHAAEVPVHFPAGSQTPADARQVLVEDTKVLAGHVTAVPLQFSATSHTSADARHTVVESATVSEGQAVEVPVQFSATSQTPAAARQTVVLGLTLSVGHTASVPVQLSATSQIPTLARHVWAAVWNVQLFLQQELARPLIAAPKSQSSPASRTPFPQLPARAGVACRRPAARSADSATIEMFLVRLMATLRSPGARRGSRSSSESARGSPRSLSPRERRTVDVSIMATPGGKHAKAPTWRFRRAPLARGFGGIPAEIPRMRTRLCGQASPSDGTGLRYSDATSADNRPAASAVASQAFSMKSCAAAVRSAGGGRFPRNA
jgi:hypothetical protein